MIVRSGPVIVFKEISRYLSRGGTGINLLCKLSWGNKTNKKSKEGYKNTEEW